jgi:predicted rRNA methylase YqxC with S4 and FtsJ domains
MSRLEYYIETNINDYVIDSCGYANIKDKNVEEELTILSHDESFLDEVMHHIDDAAEAQILLTKAVNGDFEANLKYLGMVKKGMKSYLAYLLDDLAFEGLLEEWQDNYSKEYAEEQRIDYLTEMSRI